MPIRLEGFVDNGKGAPLPNISAIVTRVDDGGIVTSGLTDAEGHWVFSGLSELEEYFVNLADGAGNAIVRGPWSGEMREAWIRDRLALPDTGLAVLPNGGNTTVGGLPLVLDPNPANVLAWGPAGLYTAGSVGLTQALADTLYEPLDSAWTKSESDARYAELTDVDPFPQYLTSTEGDARYTQGGITQAAADLRYLKLTGGDLTGPVTSTSTLDVAGLATLYSGLYVFNSTTTLGGNTVPDGTNSYDLGSTGMRWKKLWAVAGEFTNAPTVGGVAVLTATSAGLLYEPLDSAYTKAEADARYTQGGITQAAADLRYVNTAGDTMTGSLTIDPGQLVINGTLDVAALVSAYAGLWVTGTSTFDGPSVPSASNTRDLGTTALRWRALYGMTGDLSTSLTVATKPVAISPDAANIVEWRANGFYAAAGAVSDIWVNTTGDTMTGALTVTNGGANPASAGALRLPNAAAGRIAWRNAANSADISLEVDGGNFLTYGGATLVTYTLGDARYLTPTAGDTRYVNASGGDTMTGDLATNGQISFGARNGRLIHSTSGDVQAFNSVPAGFNSIQWQRWQTRAFYVYDSTAAQILFQVDQASGDTTVKGLLTTGGTTLTTDANKRVTINKLTDPALPSGYTATPGLLVQHEGAFYNGLSLARASSDTTSSVQSFWRARGTFASKVAIANADQLSQIITYAWSGANWLPSAMIRTEVSGTVTTTATPTKMDFFTADSAGTLAARLSISPAGLVGLGAKANGTAAAQIDLEATAATTPGLILRAHASYADALTQFQVRNRVDTVVLGANALGWVSDATANAGGTTVTRNVVNRTIAVYTSAGSLLGYLRLNDTTT